MKTKASLSTETRVAFRVLLHKAIRFGAILPPYDRTNFLRRANRALARNLAEPGECAGDVHLLMGLSIAEAQIGRGAGWIPAVQQLGCKIADLNTL